MFAFHLEADVVASLEQFNEAEDQPSMLRHAVTFFNELQGYDFFDYSSDFDRTTPVDTLREQVWYWAAEYFYDRQDYESSEQYGRKALPLFRMGNDRSGEADCLNILAITNVRLSDFEEALDFAQQSYKLDEQSGDMDRVASSLNTLAAIYMSAYQPEGAEQFILRGIEMAKVASNDSRRAVLLGMASEVYHALGDDNLSLDYAEQAYELELQLGREGKAMMRLSQKASALIGLHHYGEAERVLGQAILYFRDEDDLHSLAICYNKMGRVQLAMHHESEAIPYYKEASSIFQAMGDKTNEMHSRKGLYESLWKQFPDSARMELDRFNALKDSLYTNTSAKSLARYQAEFGNDWLIQENQAERLAKRNVMSASVVVILLLLVLTAFVWWMMRRRQRRQSAINQQLSVNIEELHKKYDELSVRYDKALWTSSEDMSRKDLSPFDREFLEKSLNTINEMMFTGQVDAETVAAKLNMSLFQFRQRLQAVTGETPQSFISIIRMKRARYLLDNRRDLNVSEVAQLCAYNDTPNFSRAFKKTFGISPTQYLEKCKMTEQ
jgi:AraC-like DNA-binding protein